jgi:hypothetical protein
MPHQWFERKVTVQAQTYVLRHCTRCHLDLAKSLDYDAAWTPVDVSVFHLRPSEREFTEECPPPS